jgi:TonB family protein
MRFLLAVIQFAALTAGFAGPIRNQNEQIHVTRATGPGMTLMIHVLSHTGSEKTEDYIMVLTAMIRPVWYAEVPDSAFRGEEGKVTIRFKVLRDGTLASPGPTVESSSGRKSFVTAALDGINHAAPFRPLPSGLAGKSLEIRATFFYNEKPEM